MRRPCHRSAAWLSTPGSGAGPPVRAARSGRTRQHATCSVEMAGVGALGGSWTSHVGRGVGPPRRADQCRARRGRRGRHPRARRSTPVRVGQGQVERGLAEPRAPPHAAPVGGRQPTRRSRLRPARRPARSPVHAGVPASGRCRAPGDRRRRASAGAASIRRRTGASPTTRPGPRLRRRPRAGPRPGPGHRSMS